MENKKINVDEILFRCSSLGYIMQELVGGGLTEAQEKTYNDLNTRTKALTAKQQETLQELFAKKNAPPELPKTTKTHLIDKFVSVKYGRETEIVSKYTTKGLMVEEDSLTLYSRFLGRYLTKNEETLNNEFIAGTPDVIKEHIIDIKSSWDIFTFFRTSGKDVNRMYYWQMQGYMALTGAGSATLAYCLTDTPDVLINDEKRKLLWKGGFTSELSPEYLEACEKIEKLLKYEDIPIQEKVIEIEVKRNNEDIQRIYDRVKMCREYMKTNLFKY